MWIIELSDDCWSTYSKYEPCARTLVKSSAKVFKTERKAKKVLKKILKVRIFKNAQLVNEFNDVEEVDDAN